MANNAPLAPVFYLVYFSEIGREVVAAFNYEIAEIANVLGPTAYGPNGLTADVEEIKLTLRRRADSRCSWSVRPYDAPPVPAFPEQLQ